MQSDLPHIWTKGCPGEVTEEFLVGKVDDNGREKDCAAQ
jgi:hypothetical protein